MKRWKSTADTATAFDYSARTIYDHFFASRETGPSDSTRHFCNPNFPICEHGSPILIRTSVPDGGGKTGLLRGFASHVWLKWGVGGVFCSGVLESIRSE